MTAPVNATAGTTTTLTNAGAAFSANQWAGWTVSILSGANAGESRTIVSNTATQLTVSPNWTTAPSNTSSYVIASTATIRKSQDQVHALFLRKVNVFPPHGLDFEDNFFWVSS